jgi:hypothetical protein
VAAGEVDAEPDEPAGDREGEEIDDIDVDDH